MYKDINMRDKEIAELRGAELRGATKEKKKPKGNLVQIKELFESHFS